MGQKLEEGYSISLIERVKRDSPGTNCLLFTDRESEAVVRDAINSGAAGVCFYSAIGLGEEDDLFKALMAMKQGGVYYPPVIRATAAFPIKQLPVLSARELDVLKQLCLGLSNKAIAEELVLSTETVKSYVSQIIGKMGATDRLRWVVMAIRSGF